MKLLVPLVLVFAGLLPALAGEKTIPVATRDSGAVRTVANFVNGVASISKRVSGDDFKVTVKTSKATGSLFKEGFRWGGEDAMVPPTLITSIVVQNGANKIFVPLSAYSDLGDPRRISLKSSAAGVELAIAGGDAGVAYNAVLVFEKGWLTRRRVANGEFPEQAWEETRYAYNTLNN